jgi:hypothetical protein
MLARGGIRSVNRKSKILAIVLGCVGLAVSEQAGWLSCSFSKMLSGTNVNVVRKSSPAGEHITTLQIDRPVTRWLPFVKFGETVYRRTYLERQGEDVYEHIVTTRTSQWAVGLCSTARYDELANKPFEKAEKNYAPKPVVAVAAAPEE